MAAELRKTGISVVGDMPWGTHFCHFYETKQDLLDTLVPFFKAGLESKEYCLWVVSGSDLITVEEAKGALAQAVPDLDRHLSDENIEILNRHDWYFEQHALSLERAQHGWAAKLKQALTRGFEGLRASADTFWLAEKDWKDFFVYEKQVNDWITNQSMTVMCTYPLAKSGAAEVLDVVQAHQFAIARRRGEWEVIEAPELIQAKAEIKKLNEELEQRVIERTNELRVANEELKKEITERKRVEQRLREYEKAVEGLDEMIVVVDRDYRYLLANRAFLTYCGLEREQLVGQLVSEILNPRVFENITKEKLDECFKGNIVKYELKDNFLKLGERDLFVSYFPIEGPTGIERVACVLKDITESKRADEALKESQRRLEEAQRIAHVGHWERDLETGLIIWSDEIYRILGLPPQEHDSPLTEWQHILHPEDRERVALVIEEAQRGIRRYDMEYRIVRPDGEVRFLHSQGDIIRDEQGRPRRAFGIAQDITEHKRAEEQLKQSEGRLAEAQRIAHLGSWSWDLNSKTQIWSDELYRIYGLERTKVTPTYEAFLELVHTQDRLLLSEAVERALKTREPINLYFRIIRPDGEERIINSHARIDYNDQGHPIRKFGTAQDVTVRKQTEEALREAEQKYHDIFEHAGEGIFQSTPDGRYIVANPALARMYGFASPEELIHSRQDISRQLYVDPTRREEFKRLLEEQGAVRGFEHEVFRKDGSRLWISVNARAVQDEQGAIQYYEGTTQDITERKTAEEKLKATSDQLRALSSRLQSAREAEGTRIAREIHDELGAALSSLRWDMEDVDEAISEAGEQSQLKELRKKLEAMMRLTDTTVNTVRRIASELRPIALDTLGLIEAIQLQAEQFQERTGIIVNCDCNRENVDLKPESSTAVFRILQEALTNVLRHAQATRVDVSMNETESNFVLRISDNGRGITEDEKSGQRTLGLLGMRERAHLVGGEVEIKGVDGKGTVVTVRIPIFGRVNYLEPHT